MSVRGHMPFMWTAALAADNPVTPPAAAPSGRSPEPLAVPRDQRDSAHWVTVRAGVHPVKVPTGAVVSTAIRDSSPPWAR